LQPVPLVPMVPAATAAGIFGLGPTPWRTIGTGWRYKPVPMRQHRNRFVPPPGAKCRRRYRHRLVGSTGAYYQPVPIVLQTAPGPATTRCRLTLGPKAPVCALTRCYWITFSTGS